VRSVTLDVRDPKLLFLVAAGDSAACIASLDDGMVGERLTSIFRLKHHYLSNQAKARVRVAGSAWSIMDSQRKYRLRNEAAGLAVYDYHDDPPEARLYILRRFRLVYE
jgi:hypothetical protein